MFTLHDILLPQSCNKQEDIFPVSKYLKHANSEGLFTALLKKKKSVCYRIWPIPTKIVAVFEAPIQETDSKTEHLFHVEQGPDHLFHIEKWLHDFVLLELVFIFLLQLFHSGGTIWGKRSIIF